MRLLSLRAGRGVPSGRDRRAPETGKGCSAPPGAIDLLPLSALKALRDQLAPRIAALEEAERAEALALIDDVIAGAGIPMPLVIAHLKSQGPERSGPCIYRDPNTGRTWAGRGRKPNWIKAFEASGGSLQQLLLRDEAAGSDDSGPR
ncbi:MAG: H-NS family nucleoid-associated regulatory protein [Myxococcota bacterium]